MTIFAGLDVSDKATHICVVDGEGSVVWRGVCATDPEVLAKTLAKRCSGLARVVLETGALSAFLYHGLIERGVPAICICARHAKGVLSARVNKSDPHDAEGLAHLARTGWFKAVHIKNSATHLDRASLKVAGDPMLRAALYEAANNLIARVKRPSPLQTWAKALALAKGAKRAKRARVAVARKLAILLHCLWRSGDSFRWA